MYKHLNASGSQGGKAAQFLASACGLLNTHKPDIPFIAVVTYTDSPYKQDGRRMNFTENKIFVLLITI
jgi:hypothetical protein